jgi:hypothetical protein
MTSQEKEEFTQLKYIHAERGFWLPNEEARWSYLFHLHAKSFISAMKKFDLAFKQEELN